MMKAMRENTKIILWVVVVAFVVTIFAVWGLDLQSGSMNQQQSVVGRVDGVEVPPDAYQRTYSQMAQQFRDQAGGELTTAQQEMIREQAWENLVSSILTGKEIEKLGITVSDEEILNFLRTSPPPEIQQYFVDKEGKFDYAAYQSALNNPEADWSSVEDLARQRIPMIKLNQYLMAQVHVSAAEVRRAFDEENVKLVAEFIALPIESESLGEWTPGDAEVQAYFDAHADRFKTPEKATLEYVKIPLAVSAQDRADVLASARDIARTAADDFATTAKTYSETHTASVGGETGLIARNQRDEAVMQAVDRLEPGQISEPVQTAEGVYIVQLVETKKEKGETRYNLREIFMKLAPGPVTVDSLSAIARDVQARATESGDLAAAAKAKGLTVETTPSFAQLGPVPGLGFVPAASRFAFGNEVGKVSQVLGDERAYYVCRVAARTPAASTPVADVAATIKDELTRERKLASARRKAEAFRKSAANPEVLFARAAEQYGYRLAKTDSFTVATPPTGQGTAFARAAMATPVDQVSYPIDSADAVFIIHVTGRREGETAVFKTRAPQLLQQMRSQKIQEYVTYWYASLKERSKIEDFRDALAM